MSYVWKLILHQVRRKVGENQPIGKTMDENKIHNNRKIKTVCVCKKGGINLNLNGFFFCDL